MKKIILIVVVLTAFMVTACDEILEHREFVAELNRSKMILGTISKEVEKEFEQDFKMVNIPKGFFFEDQITLVKGLLYSYWEYSYWKNQDAENKNKSIEKDYHSIRERMKNSLGEMSYQITNIKNFLWQRYRILDYYSDNRLSIELDDFILSISTPLDSIQLKLFDTCFQNSMFILPSDNFEIPLSVDLIKIVQKKENLKSIEETVNFISNNLDVNTDLKISMSDNVDLNLVIDKNDASMAKIAYNGFNKSYDKFNPHKLVITDWLLFAYYYLDYPIKVIKASATNDYQFDQICYCLEDEKLKIILDVHKKIKTDPTAETMIGSGVGIASGAIIGTLVANLPGLIIGGITGGLSGGGIGYAIGSSGSSKYKTENIVEYYQYTRETNDPVDIAVLITEVENIEYKVLLLSSSWMNRKTLERDIIKEYCNGNLQKIETTEYINFQKKFKDHRTSGRIVVYNPTTGIHMLFQKNVYLKTFSYTENDKERGVIVVKNKLPTMEKNFREAIKNVQGKLTVFQKIIDDFPNYSKKKGVFIQEALLRSYKNSLLKLEKNMD